MTDYQRFEELSAMTIEQLHENNGVGTLTEKFLHIFLKNYFESDKSYHEVKVGRFTADICRDNSIIEIQTHNLNALRDKLEYYMLEGYDVCVVHPVTRVRKMLYVDRDTGEIVKKRRFPHIGNLYDSIPELYKIKYFLDWDKLTVRLMLFDIEEYRELSDSGVTSSGKKKRQRSMPLEKKPVAVAETIILDNPMDYLIFLPDSLPKEFSSRDFMRCANVSQNLANMTLNILKYLGTVEHFKNDGQRYIYRINKYFDSDFGGVD